MNATIGAAGGRDVDLLAGDRGKRGLDNVLDRTAPRLGLPAEKAAAVVFQS
jgi:hypothetical protein